MPVSADLFIFLLVSLGTFAAMVALSVILGPKRLNPAKNEPFECGSPLLSPNPGRVHVRFYLLAMMFIVFDIETVLMYPWAMIYLSDLGLKGLVEMGLFVAVLAFGLAYVWRKGGLEWD